MTKISNISAKNNFDFTQENYWINLDKPKDISSAFAVKIIKKIIKAKKVGHGGTLDPFATGVLPIAINKSTKQSSKIMDFKKKYYFTIIFGEFRDSDDVTGKVIEVSEKRISLADFSKNISNFIGKIKQQPSKFSAIKINGERSYSLARKGLEVEMPIREIEIYSIKILNYLPDYCEMEIECSKGTYVRSLARDICKKNNICGYVGALKRKNVGQFLIDKTISLDELKNIVNFGQSNKDGSLLALHEI
jgi:tRNA pseudouridine55 synthase